MKLTNTQKDLLKSFTEAYTDLLRFNLLTYGRLRNMQDFMTFNKRNGNFHIDDLFLYFKDPAFEKYEEVYSLYNPEEVPEELAHADIYSFAIELCYFGVYTNVTFYPNGEKGSGNIIEMIEDDEPDYTFDSIVYDYLEIDMNEYPKAYKEIHSELFSACVDIAERVEALLERELKEQEKI